MLCYEVRNAIEERLSVVTPVRPCHVVSCAMCRLLLHTLMPPSPSSSSPRLCGALALGVLLANVGDGETWTYVLAVVRIGLILCVVKCAVGERVPGGRLCLSFSALSVSLRTRV